MPASAKVLRSCRMFGSVLLALVLGIGGSTPAQARTIPGVSGVGSRAVLESLPLRPLETTTSLGRMPDPVRDIEALIEQGREAAAGGEAEAAGREGEAAFSGPGGSEEGRPTPAANPDAPSTRPAAPLRRTGGQRVAVTSPSGFDGPTLADTSAFPPDTQGDVGPSQYIVAVNGRLRSYAKATGLADGVMNMNPDTFFASVMTPVGGTITGNLTSDPHIRYDRLSQKWYIVIIDVPFDSVGGGFNTHSNRVLLAVSDGPTISAGTVWQKFFWSEDLAAGADNQFADYPTLGIDQNALYIGMNMFSNAGSYLGTRAYVVQKSSVQAAGPVAVTKFGVVTTPNGPGAFTPQGVDDRTGNAAVGWFVGVDNAFFGQLDFYKVNNPGSVAPTLSAMMPLTVAATASPSPVPHLGNTGGSNGRLNSLDDRLFSANLRGGHIWTAHGIGVNSAGVAASPTRNASRWYEADISSGSPTLVQSGTVFDPAPASPLSYWIATVNVNGQGTMAMGGSVAGALAHADTFFTGRRAGDPANTTDVPTTATATAFAYNPPSNLGGSTGRRWGDYSFVSVDPEDDQTMWSIQEYTSSANVYGTRITKLRAAAPTFTTIVPATLARPSAVSQVTVTGTGFFDPGSAFPKRLAVTSDCGASGITITGTPTPTTVTFDTVAPVAGPCVFTVVNPDGQQVASSAVPVVQNAGPVVAGDAASTPRDTVLNGASVLANDTDPEADPLTAQKQSDPEHGTVTLRADGTFAYTPAAGYAGPDAFTYTASDGALTSAAATVTLTVAATNRAPAGGGDTGTTARDVALNGASVLANDTDPDGNPLTAVKATDPAHGSVTLALAGTYVYKPARGYTGPDAFTYRASDGPAQSTPTTVALTVTKPETCKVPQTKGLTVKQAQARLRKAGCGKVVTKRVRTRSVKRGRVLTSSPAAGKTISVTAKVTLKIRR